MFGLLFRYIFFKFILPFNADVELFQFRIPYYNSSKKALNSSFHAFSFPFYLILFYLMSINYVNNILCNYN